VPSEPATVPRPTLEQNLGNREHPFQRIIEDILELLPFAESSRRTPIARLQKGLDQAYLNYASAEQVIRHFINSTRNSVLIILEHGEQIKAAAERHGVPREAIQAVMFQEIRTFCLSDIATDELARLQIRPNNSTGIGQIRPSTAIDAHNWFYGTDYDKSNQEHLHDFWGRLQDNDFNIDMVGMVLAHKQDMLGEEATMQDLLQRYNGFGDGAVKYGAVAIQYFELFKIYNNSVN
jgi:hypothetical protein